MRVLVWNMGAGSPGASSTGHDRAWKNLRDRDDFDFALLQETRKPPPWADQYWASHVWRPKYAGRRGARALWGCAVVARAFDLAPYEPDETFPWLRALPGSTAIASTTTHPTWLASVHLHASPIPNDVARGPLDGIELTARDGSVWETNVVPHELHRLFDGRTFMWGGDLNTDPRMDDIRGFLGGNRRLFALYGEAGALDARTRFHANFQQTYFKPPRRPYQLDHVFVDAATDRRLTGWNVDAAPVEGPVPLSDHAPIVVTLDETPLRTAPVPASDLTQWSTRPKPAVVESPSEHARPPRTRPSPAPAARPAVTPASGPVLCRATLHWRAP